jgi:hypothetical protein
MTDLPDPIVEEALRVLTQAMRLLTDDQRMEVLNRLFENYCVYCGAKSPCYCIADD